MGDDITIGVTEIVNNIEVTAQPNDQIVDISVIDNADEVTLNITPTVIEINVNKGSSYARWGTIYGNITDQTDLQNALLLKADLVDGKVPAYQLPSFVDDIIEVANYAALPATGEIGKIYVTLDNNKIYRWSGSVYIEIAANNAIWGAITGTLSNQTDLVNALNLRVPYTGATSNVNLGEYGLTSGFLGLDTTPTSTPTGIGTIYWDAANRTAALIDGDGDTTLQIGQEQRILVHNNTGSTLTDGQVVYVTGSTGNLPSVSLANASSETTSAATLGVVTESIANGADGFITTSGIVNGLNTLAFNEGDLLWLGTTAGTFTATKPISPNHLVLIGYVIKKAGGNGSILVKIQNTQELEESSDVLFTSLANNQVLTYESATDLWKNKSIATILGYTPANDASVVKLTGDQSITGSKSFTTNTAAPAMVVTNNSTDNGILLQNTSTGNALRINNGALSIGDLIRAGKDGNVTFIVNQNGNTTAASFIKSGGTSSQFLKADGSVDSSTYALTSQLHDAVTIGTANGLSLSGQVLSLALASPTTRGALTSEDYNYFFDKVQGNGNQNYIPKYTLSGSNKVIGNSQIYDNGTNVGIGTTTPDSQLVVNGASNSRINMRAGDTRYGTLYVDSGLFAVGSTISIPLILATNDTEKMRITSGGNVGIGTATPYSATNYNFLTIDGTNGSGYVSRVNSVNSFLFYSNASGSTLSEQRALPLLFETNGSEKMRLTTNGELLIGRTSSYGAGWLVNVEGNIYATADIRADYGVSSPQITVSQNNGMYGLGTNIVGFKTNDVERMRITSGGDVLVGTTTAITSSGNTSVGATFGKSYNWLAITDSNYVQRSNNTDGAVLTFLRGATNVGNISITSSATSYNTSSDYRLKEDLKPINGLDLVSQINVYDYKWKYNETRAYGVLAHELQEVIPQAVNGEKDAEEMQSVDYSKLVPILVQAIQELKAEIEILKNK